MQLFKFIGLFLIGLIGIPLLLLVLPIVALISFCIYAGALILQFLGCKSSIIRDIIKKSSEYDSYFD